MPEFTIDFNEYDNQDIKKIFEATKKILISNLSLRKQTIYHRLLQKSYDIEINIRG
jgi:hypothetical protein